MTDLRADGAAALDWAASYLERVGELPVLAHVLRLAVGQMSTTEDDLRRAWEVLRRQAAVV